MYIHIYHVISLHVGISDVYVGATEQYCVWGVFSYILYYIYIIIY